MLYFCLALLLPKVESRGEGGAGNCFSYMVCFHVKADNSKILALEASAWNVSPSPFLVRVEKLRLREGGGVRENQNCRAGPWCSDNQVK